jgi:hypothetical protein
MTDPMFEKTECDLEKALRALEPASLQFNRDRLMFEAGRAPHRRRRWLWPSACSLLAAAVIIQGIVLLDRPGAREVVRYVRVEVPVPTPGPSIEEDPRPGRDIRSRQMLAKVRDPGDDFVGPRDNALAYYRVREKVLRFGVASLPGVPPLPGEQKRPERKQGILDPGIP